MKTNHKPQSTTGSSIEVLETRIAPATFTVTTLTDSVPGSLRAELALADAQGGHNTIVFHLPAATSPNENTIMLTGGVLTSKGNVTIDGPGAGRLIISGGSTSGVFDFNSTVSATDSPVSISGVSIVDGSAASGAGIFSDESLTLKNVVVSGNVATGSNGGVYVGGNATAGTKVAISNSLITSNGAVDFSGGVGLHNVTSFTMSNTVITGNMAMADGGGGIGALLNSSGTKIDITGCQITGNSASYGGGLQLTATSSPFCSTCKGRSTVKFKSDTSLRRRMTVSVCRSLPSMVVRM